MSNLMANRRYPSAGRRSRVALVAVATVGLLAGCVHPSPSPSPSTLTSAAPTVSPSPTVAADPVFLAGGSAEANKPFFDLVNGRLFAGNGSANGQAIIENLVKSGFMKADMQLTPDRTVGNLQADSVLFSVKIGQFCLLGQYGGGAFSSAVEPILTSGVCLVGATRVIDF